MTRRRTQTKRSTELTLLWGLKTLVTVPEPIHDQVFVKGRRWRPDFRWPDERVIVEVEGINSARGYGQSRHLRPDGFEDDCEKYNAFTELGYVVLRYTTRMIDNDMMSVLQQIERVVKSRQQPAQQARSATERGAAYAEA